MRAWQVQVEHYRGLILKVIDQTERRVFKEEAVPASEKIAPAVGVSAYCGGQAPIVGVRS